MACFSPLDAFQADDGEIRFAERGQLRRALRLPCGQCIGCRLDRSQMWAVRCSLESQMHDESCFVTLTYEDAPVSLSVLELQKFLKRVRKRFRKLRYFACGEYGEQSSRAHYHALLFGIGFGDRQLLSDGQTKLYRSAELEKLWSLGHSSVGDVTFESAQYCAGYAMKKVRGERAKSHYTRLDPATGELVQVQPEFALMSRRPGIGRSWLEKYWQDVYTSRDGVILKGGRKVKAPRYFDNWLKAEEPDCFEGLEIGRSERTEEQLREMEESRLRVREAVKKAQVAFYARKAL